MHYKMPSNTMWLCAVIPGCFMDEMDTRHANVIFTVYAVYANCICSICKLSNSDGALSMTKLTDRLQKPVTWVICLLMKHFNQNKVWY